MENGAALLTLAQIISELPGSIWTVVVILLLVLICQPFFLLYGLFKLREEMKRGQEVQDKRFESAVKMYEDNVLLVRNYEKLAGGFNEVLPAFHRQPHQDNRQNRDQPVLPAGA
jgi:hypothetical protein